MPDPMRSLYWKSQFAAEASVMMMKCQPILVVLAVAMLAFIVGGCVKVAPYERGMLAHPTMTPEEIAIGLDGHVRAVSGGAAGGLGGGGGGCGCN